MKIAVTGGAGFIGSKVTDFYLEEGAEVVVIDNLSTGKTENINPKAKFFKADITDENIIDIFAEEKFDVLNCHAAQIDVRTSVANPKYDAKINVLGALNLYEAARRTGVKKIIFASTGGAIYGEQDYFPADENHPVNPLSPYGVAKLVNEKYLFFYKEAYGIDFVSLRYTNVYGPRQNPFGEAGVVAIFANKMLAGGEPVINGDGKNSRDYVFVEDVARANLCALRNDISGIYNVATEKEKDVNFIFSTLKRLTGSNCEEIHGEAKTGEQRRSVCSYSKLKEECGWEPRIDMDKGLKQTVEFFKRKNKKE